MSDPSGHEGEEPKVTVSVAKSASVAGPAPDFKVYGAATFPTTAPPPPSPLEIEAGAKGRAIGREWGQFAGDVQNFLDTMKDVQGKVPSEERDRDIRKMLDRFERLSLPDGTFETEGERAAYAAGFASGFGTTKFTAAAAMVAIALFHDMVASGGLRLPDATKWGRWAGTPGNSKFILNAAGKKQFGVIEGAVDWVRFTKGKADFSAVAYAIEGNVKSLRVPALKNAVKAGTTADQLRRSDEGLVLSELSKKWGKTEAQVAAFLKENNLRIHHYKDDLVQLVPKNYHRIAHEGTVKERLARASLMASFLGIGAITDELFDQMAHYQRGTYGK